MRLKGKTLRRVAYAVGAALILGVVVVFAAEGWALWKAGQAGIR